MQVWQKVLRRDTHHPTVGKGIIRSLSYEGTQVISAGGERRLGIDLKGRKSWRSPSAHPLVAFAH